MNRWLENEVKWSREKAVEAQTALDQLRDPKWREREARKLQREAQALRLTAQNLEAQARSFTEPEQAEDAIARKEREVFDWLGMAEQASKRLAETEDGALFETEEA